MLMSKAKPIINLTEPDAEVIDADYLNDDEFRMNLFFEVLMSKPKPIINLTEPAAEVTPMNKANQTTALNANINIYYSSSF